VKTRYSIGNQRGISTEDAIGLIVNGYAREVLNKLPMEFAVEAQKLLQISLEEVLDKRQKTKDDIMLAIKDLKVEIDGKDDIKGSQP